jgi:hypothetical protein
MTAGVEQQATDENENDTQQDQQNQQQQQQHPPGIKVPESNR